MRHHYSLEPGSYRDRNGRVYCISDEIFRGLSKQALKEWEYLSSTDFFHRFINEGKIIYSERVEHSKILDPKIRKEWAGFLKHQVVPYISYPYEWSFGMLKDTALLHLELLEAALSENMIIKDSSSFNFQWLGTDPTFIDIPSFIELKPGEPWVAYKQFCQMFLFPLFLQAYKNIPYHYWLRGHIDGIEPEHCNAIMSLRDFFRPGIFLDVYLQTKLSISYGHSNRNVKKEISESGFNKNLIKSNVKRIRKIIQRLYWKRFKSEWSNYSIDHSYGDMDYAEKKNFVRNVIISKRWKLVWDLGCNTGVFSRIAAENASYVLSIDNDHLSIERFYQELKREGNKRILPIINNVTDPSPNLGWRGLERKTLEERGKPDLILCLALIHHIVINANIPLAEFIQWVASLGADIIIEFVSKDDEMVKKLLLNKEDIYEDYDRDYFEHCISENYHIERQKVLKSQMRILYFAKNKSND